MDCLSLWQTVMPESLLVEIFGHLDIRALGRAAQTCSLWRRISLDDFLWRNLARKQFKITGTSISLTQTSWRDEMKRLVYHLPCVESELYDVHQDEVLDVAISHNGRYFCTTSKDRRAILWYLDFPSFILSDVDVGSLLSWELTQYSSFNESDTLVFVCGVSLPSDTEMQEGRGAVFTVPEMILVCSIELDPPTLFGAWMTDRVFIGGNLTDTMDLIKIESYKITDEELAAAKHRGNTEDIYVSTLNKSPTTVFTFLGHQYHQMHLLVASIPKSSKLEMGIVDGNPIQRPLSGSRESLQASNSLDLDESDAQRTDKALRSSKVHNHLCEVGETKGDNNEVVNSDGRFPTSIIDLTKSSFGEAIKSNKKSKACSVELDEEGRRILRKPELGAESGASGEPDLGAGKKGSEKAWDCDRCSACDNNNSQNKPKAYFSETHQEPNTQWSDLNSHEKADTYLSSEQEQEPMDMTCAMDTSCVDPDQRFTIKQDFNTYILFVTGDHDAIAVHEIKGDKLAGTGEREPLEGEVRVEEIDHYFHIKDCYITGLSLSSDQRYLFFNYREFDQALPINQQADVELRDKISSENLKIGTIDLVNMTRLTDKEYTGHMAFSEYPAWYICLDASPSYIGSGSEEGRGYLWDRRHGVLLTTLGHKEGVVNGIAFSPSDEETCITVCDDRYIKIWRSKNRLRHVCQFL